MTSLYKSRPDTGDYTSEIVNALNEAEAAQAAAELAATNAATSETNAATSESNAATSETNAATSEGNAASSAASANAYASAASADRTLAESARDAAIAAEAVVAGAVPVTRTVNTYPLSSNVLLVTSDISDTVNARYVTDADIVKLGNLSGTNTGDQDLSGLVPKTTTVNGHALSGNVTVTNSDVGLGNVQNLDQTNPANVTQSASYRFVTDTEKSTWNGKQNLLVVYSGTFSSFPAASGYNVGDQAFASDVGENGTYFVVSAYDTWIPLGGSAILAMLPLPVGKAPTFTGTTDGAITFGSAVSYNDKCYMYYPANSLVASHAAGFYYTECSSTTYAIVYDNTYVPAAGVYPTEPVSKTAFSGAVPGGTGASTEVTAFIYGVPANIMGSHGVIDGNYGEEHTTATGKTVRFKVAGTTISTFSSGSNVRSLIRTVTANIGSTGVQKSYASTSATTANVRTTIDTTATFEISVTLQGAATSHCTLTSCELTLKRSR